MSDKPVNESRRDAVKAMVGGLAAVPLMNLVGVAAAQAEDVKVEDLPRVKKDDPTAQALRYTDKAPEDKKQVDQTCATCQFVNKEDTGDWRRCQLFPEKSVAAEGWCASWMKKSGA